MGERKLNVVHADDDIYTQLGRLRAEVSALRLWLAFVCGIVSVMGGILGAVIATWR